MFVCKSNVKLHVFIQRLRDTLHGHFIARINNCRQHSPIVLLPHRSTLQGLLTDPVSDHVKKIWPWEERCTISLNNVQ